MEPLFLPTLESLALQGDCAQVSEFLSHFRVKFTNQQSFPFPKPLLSSLLDLLQRFLSASFSQSPEGIRLSSESLWLISNIIATLEDNTCLELVSKGLIIDVLRCLDSKHLEVLENALWALANISGCSFEFRDLILNSKALVATNMIKSNLGLMLKIETKPPNSKSSRKTVLNPLAWLLGNLVRGPPFPEFKRIKPFIGTLIELLYEPDLNVLKDAVHAWSQITQHCSLQDVKILNNFGLMTKVLGVLAHNLASKEKLSLEITIECLKVIGDLIVVSSKEQMRMYSDYNIVKLLEKALGILSDNAGVTTVCWILGNMATGTSDQIELLLKDDIYQKMIRNLMVKNAVIQEESLNFFSNLIEGATVSQRNVLVKRGILSYFFKLIHAHTQDEKKILIVLRNVAGLLDSCQPLCVGIEASWRNGIDKLAIVHQTKPEVIELCKEVQSFFEDVDLKTLGAYLNISFFPFQED